jgi:hypothetical protein
MSFRGDAPAVKHEAVEDWGRVSMMTPLILKRAALSRSSGQWDDDAYDVLEHASLSGASFWRLPRQRADSGCGRAGTAGHIKRAAHGFKPTREAAMAAFAKSWRRE